MNIKIICFTLILSLVPSIATPSTTQESILDALRADIPSYIVASKVDQLIREDPSCRTVNFLRFILQNYPSNKKMIFRIARRFNQLNCKEYADSLERILRQLGEQLSITQSVNKLLGSSNLTYKPLTPFVLQVQEGFYLKTGDLFRAALSPSKRYLSVGQMGENGSLTIWDLETGYLVSSRSEHFTLISTFINDRYLLVASQIGIKLWDVVENKQFILSLGMGIPTFLELSPDRKQLIINNLNGEVTIYEVLKSKRIAPFQLKRKHIVTELKAQVGQFIDHKTLLLGNDDGELFLYDIEQRKVLSSLSSIFLGELPIKKQDNFEFEIMRTLIVRQQIAISEDGQRYAVLINKQLALVERKDGKLNLIPTIAIREKSINSVMFTPEHLIVLTDTQLLYFAVDGELVQKFDLPPKLKKAKCMQKLDESSVVLIGEEFLSIYDLERRTVLSQHLAKINSPFKSNTRLIDANNLLFYTAKNGMRRVNFSKMPDAIKKNDVLFELLYRGSLANSKASERLFNLDKYQDIFYWIESPRPETKDEDRETYFYYLQPSSDPKKDSEIGFVKMPDLLNLEHLNKKADGFSKAIVPELSKFINNFNNLAFNGETVAFINNGKLKLLSVIDHKIRALSNLTDVVKLAFHPKNKQRLVIARQGGQIEIWDIRLQKRVQKLKLRLHQQQITRLSFDSSGQYLAILSTQHLDIWDISLNQIRFSKKVKGSGLLTLAFDSTRLIGTGGDLDGAGANLLVVDMKKMTAKTYHVDSHLGVWGDVTFGCDSNHFIETNFLSSELSLYEITKNG
jgi:WD40 repeat protein